MASLDITRYGMVIKYGEPSGTGATKKTYNGLNFLSDDAHMKANQLTAFVKGQFELNPSGGSEGGFAGIDDIADALGLQGGGVLGYDLTQLNSVTAN